MFGGKHGNQNGVDGSGARSAQVGVTDEGLAGNMGSVNLRPVPATVGESISYKALASDVEVKGITPVGDGANVLVVRDGSVQLLRRSAGNS